VARWGVLAYLLSAMVVCTFIDFDFRILPDEITKSGIVLALAVGAVFPEWHGGKLPDVGWLKPMWMRGLAASGLGALLGWAVIYGIGVAWKGVFRPLFKLIYRVTGIRRDPPEEGMGFGDVKYMAFLGGFLGWKALIVAIILSVLAGSLLGGLICAIRRRWDLPFGPYLSLGAAAMLLFDEAVYGGLNAYLDWLRSFSVPA
jgi:leader peptidase (prepilin peptidase)/N-methyltransferase